MPGNVEQQLPIEPEITFNHSIKITALVTMMSLQFFKQLLFMRNGETR